LTVGRKVITFSNPGIPPIVGKPSFDNASLNGGSCDGFDTSDHFDSFASWHGTGMAAQQELGLWTKRGHRFGSANCFNPAADAGHLKTEFGFR
jgi:hypothetical protein